MRSVQRTGDPAEAMFTWGELSAWVSGSEVDESDQDIAVGALLAEVTEDLEDYLGRTLISTPWILTLDREDLVRNASGDLALRIPRPPLQSVETVTTYGVAHTAVPVAATDFTVLPGEHGRLLIPSTVINSWPELREHSSMEVEFTAGYGDTRADVPRRIQLAVRELFAFHRQHRGEGFVLRRVITGDAGGEQISYTPRYIAKIRAAVSRYRVQVLA